MAADGQLVPVSEVPPPTTADLLTDQFYAWERRGRGWQLWPHPVELEPPYRPFLFHWASPLGPALDDARKPTLLSVLAETVRGWLVPPPPAAESDNLPAVFEWPEPEPEPFEDDSPLVEVRVSLPPELKITREVTEQFLLSLSYASRPVSFEVLGLPGAIAVQFASRAEDLPELRQQLRAHFPEAVPTEEREFLARHWGEVSAKETVIVEFGLSREFMLPLQTPKGLEPDPLITVAGALSEIGEGEVGVFQLLLQAVRYPWTESVVRAVTDWEGGAFFADAPEMIPLARQKVSRPLFAAVVRVAVQSPTRGHAWRIARALGGALRQFGSPMRNELIPLENEGYDGAEHLEDLLLRRSRRSGMILNSEELASLAHLPSASVRAEKFVRQAKKTRAAPASAAGHRLVLGENVHAGRTATVTLSSEQRIRHTYVIGASGTGKSTLLLNMIVQDIRNGEGVSVLDPHGDLIDQVLGHIPEERHADVVLLDPSDADYPVGCNILQAHSELEKNLLSSDLVAVFRRLSTSWGDQMTSVLGNAVLAFLESSEGGTLADLRRFLVEPDFRSRFLATVQDPEVVYYWRKEFPLLTGKPQGPILTRLDTFLRPRLIRNMVGQRENRLDFATIMNEGKIFLAKLAQGAIGEENAYLLGAFLVSKLQQTAMSRQEQDESARRPFFFYIDEFHNFATPSMAAILAGARKYRLGLVLAHQDLRQLSRGEEEVLGAVLSNPATRICFRVGDLDARKLEEGFSSFNARDLQSLEVGEAICRIERADWDFNLKTHPLPAVEAALARTRREKIVVLSRERYATRREEVEAALRTTRIESEPPAPQPARKEVRAEMREPVVAAAPPPPSTGDLRQRVPRPAAPPTPGRGGAQHKYLQELIKRWGESRGWRAEVEKQILDGLGSVDVALERAGLAVAVEISVTSSPEQEVGNIEKCLAAGFQHVAVVSYERKALSKIRSVASAVMGEPGLALVCFFAPEELFAFLEELETEAAGSEATVRGYKVKVRHRPMGPEEKETRKQVISRVIIDAVRRLRRARSD